MTVAQEASGAALVPAVSETAERLFQEHSGWIYGYCLRSLRSPEEAEDALQATYLNACRSLNAGVRPSASSAWLLRIAQNVCLTRLRSTGRRDRLEYVQDVAVIEETVPAPERPAEELIGLTGALASLPDRQRHAILLREWQGLSHREVAHRLGLTRAAAETLIFRARRSLADALENPGARERRRGLRALDLGGLVTAVKSLLVGGAGAKTVAAVTVVAATTVTLGATDPAGVWRATHEPVATKAAKPAVRPLTAPAVSSGGPVWIPADAALRSPEPRAGRPSRPGHGSPKGRGLGHASAGEAKGKAKVNGAANGLAFGHAKKAAADPKTSKAKGPPTTARASSTQPADPPDHAQAKGLAKRGHAGALERG
jgi:RNA polymerase sigma factor (sigma-70 family)